jgi:hypothetical protein
MKSLLPTTVKIAKTAFNRVTTTAMNTLANVLKITKKVAEHAAVITIVAFLEIVVVPWITGHVTTCPHTQSCGQQHATNLQNSSLSA